MSNPRYILSKRIARGGMAEIYLGKQVGEDGFARICAIKRILPHYSQDAEFVEMFRDEAHICKRLQHANIVRVEGFEEVEGSYAIIMELVNGADLRSLLASCEKSGHRIPVPVACYIIAEAARGLHYAHTKIDEITSKPLDIVHRDISPQNLLLSFEGEIKVTDFGIADSDNKMTETKPGIVKGKYAYMSPEQISGKPVDARTDVFALSIVLWEMLTMRRLFHGDNEVETINLVRACKIPTPMTQYNRDVSPQLEEIILKGLAKEKKMRYQSAGDLEVALRIFMNQNFPSFTPKDLAQLMRLVLTKKIQESQEDIKKVLTETNQKPNLGVKGNAAQPVNERLSNAISHGHNVEAPPSFAIAPRSPLTRANVAMPGQFSSTGPTNTRARASAQQARTSSYMRSGTGAGTGVDLYNARRLRKNPATKLMVGLMATFAVAIIGGLNYIMKAKRTPDLLLQTTPPTAKVYYNQSPLFNGNYVDSPISIPELPEGEGTIKVVREGYEVYKFQINVKRGKSITKDSIVLKQSGQFSPVKVLTKPGVEGVEINIDQGFARGTAPLYVQDLTYGVTHKATIFPNRRENPKDSFECSFTPNAVDLIDPFILLVDLKKRACSQQIKR